MRVTDVGGRALRVSEGDLATAATSTNAGDDRAQRLFPTAESAALVWQANVGAVRPLPSFRSFLRKRE